MIISCCRERVSGERRTGGSVGNRPRNTGVGDRDPGWTGRVIDHVPIRKHSRGTLLPRYGVDAGHHCCGKLHPLVSATRKVRIGTRVALDLQIIISDRL